MHTRRTFLRTLGLATTGTFMMGPWNIRSLHANTTGVPRNFVFCYFNGGWDQTLALDPRDPKKFDDSSKKLADTGIELGWDRLPNSFDDGTRVERQPFLNSRKEIMFGPAMLPMVPHMKDCCVVRGVMMDTVAHDIGRRYFITGEMPAGLAAKGSSWGTRIVAQQSELTPIPNLVVRVETYNASHPAFATGLKTTSATDLRNTLRRGPEDAKLSEELRKLVADYHSTAKNTCDPTRLDENGLMALVRQSHANAKTLVDENLGGFFDFFNKSDKDMVQLVTDYGIATSNDPGAQAAMAFQSLKHELAQCVTIELARGLDTHIDNWADDQPNRLYSGFKALAALIKDLKRTPHPHKNAKGDTLFDHTTIVCFSEFARTPRINSKEGRDHFLVSSCLLAGAGVPKNRVIGGTSDNGMAGHSIDPISGTPSTSGIFINPGHILASLMDGAGYTTDELRDAQILKCLIA